MLTRLAVLLATFGYSGFAPIAPGTVGSAVALALAVLAGLHRGGAAAPIVAAVLFFTGVWASTVTARFLGRHDPGPVVLDEVVGMLISIAWLPLGWTGLAAAFFLFRLFDVIKPYPANRLEDLPDGWGIMADDVMAGIYVNLVLRLLLAFTPWFGR